MCNWTAVGHTFVLLQTARTNVWPTADQLPTKPYGSKEELEETATSCRLDYQYSSDREDKILLHTGRDAGGGSGFLSAACKSLWSTLCRLFNEDCVSQAVAAQAVCLAQGYWTRFVTLWMSARVWLITQLAYLILYCHAMLSLCQWSLPSEPTGLTPYFDAIPTKELCCSEPEDFQMWHRKRTLQGQQVPERKLCYRKWQLPFRRLHR